MNSKTINYVLLLIFLIPATILFFHNSSLKECGISKDEIVLGQSCALSGPANRLGSDFMQGANAYFKYINSLGGINGRQIKLISVDDMYEPSYAVKNSRDLITKDKVFALFGEIGTPTSKAALRVAKEYNTPFLTPFTGAQFLRKEKSSQVINFRSSYFQETEALVEYLTTEKKIDRISVFYQNDSYGKAGYEGVVNALKKRNIKLLSEGRYRRNTLSYMNALSAIKDSNPEAIILIGTYKPSAHFIKSAKLKGLSDTIFCNISFVGSEALVKALEYKMENILISQVVPLPWDSSNTSVKEYQDIYKKYFPSTDYSFVSLEGFLSAKLVAKALHQAGKNIDRKTFMSAFKELENSVLEDLYISFGKNDNQASDSVYITKYEKNKFIQISKKVN